jgi:hypothetical protein
MSCDQYMVFATRLIQFQNKTILFFFCASITQEYIFHNPFPNFPILQLLKNLNFQYKKPLTQRCGFNMQSFIIMCHCIAGNNSFCPFTCPIAFCYYNALMHSLHLRTHRELRYHIRWFLNSSKVLCLSSFMVPLSSFLYILILI